MLRYVERNAKRAKLVRKAENWRWSSLHWLGVRRKPDWLSNWPVDRPRNWRKRVNQAETKTELQALRRSVNRGTPFGGDRWAKRAAARLGMESSLRPRGRPRKNPEK